MDAAAAVERQPGQIAVAGQPDLLRGHRRLPSEKEIFLKTGTGTRYIRLTVPTQIVALGRPRRSWSAGPSSPSPSSPSTPSAPARCATGPSASARSTRPDRRDGGRARHPRRRGAPRQGPLHRRDGRGLRDAGPAPRLRGATARSSRPGSIPSTPRSAAPWPSARQPAPRPRRSSPATRPRRPSPATTPCGVEETTASLDLVSDVLARTAVERDAIAAVAAEARAHVDDLILEQRLVAEKNDRIFAPASRRR